MIGMRLNKQATSLIEKSITASTFTKTATRTLVKCNIPSPIKSVKPTMLTNIRAISTTAPLFQSTQIPQDLFYVEDFKSQGYVVLKLNKKPVNSLNLEFLTAMNIQLDKIEESKDIKGVILTSNCQNIFSAGLDILEMYNNKPERIRQFWSALQDFWLKLYGSNKIFIAAINGHSPAGGCLMAICCDYRVMAKGPYKIGLNETLLGITAPFWFKDTMVNTIGHRETELALQLGKLYTAEEALSVKLVDELAEPTDVLIKAQEQMVKWCKIPQHARELSKTSMRHETMSLLMSQKANDIENFVSFITKESIQMSLKMYLESLKKPKKA